MGQNSRLTYGRLRNINYTAMYIIHIRSTDKKAKFHSTIVILLLTKLIINTNLYTYNSY